MVPVISTNSGTMLKRDPPWNVEMLTTVGDFIRLVRRLTTVWRPDTICAAVVIGWIVLHGWPAWPWRPVTLMRNSSALAIAAPGREPIQPAGIPDTMCKPKRHH